jgi:hypothetical protein
VDSPVPRLIAITDGGTRRASAGVLLAIGVQARSPAREANPARPGVRGDGEAAPSGKADPRDAAPARKASREIKRARTADRHWWAGMSMPR